jgi:cytosolic carboxypeptidase protein 2/3
VIDAITQNQNSRKRALDHADSMKDRFLGMNPLMKHKLEFDSDFESGNLDFAIEIKPKEYDLYMRVDPNTRGHL